MVRVGFLGIILLIFLLPTTVYCQQKGNIEIHLRGIQYPYGKIYIGLFDSTNHFGIRFTQTAYKHEVIEVDPAGVNVVFKDIPAGHYAIALFQDENGDGKFQYWEEDYSLSNEGVILYKTPNFKRSKFYFDGFNQVFTIYLENERGLKISKANAAAVAPVIAYAPETKFQGGLSLIYLFKLRPDTVTRTSYIDTYAFYTQNNQFQSKLSGTVFTPEEKFLITGYGWFQYFPQFYYGIGNDLKESGKEQISYYQAKTDVLLQRKVLGNVFAGFGYRYANVFKLKSDTLGPLYQSKYYGHQGAEISGVQFAITSDYRDNIYYAAKGHYLRLKTSYHFKEIGSNYEFHLIETELRKYFKVFRNKWDVIAFQIIGYFAQGHAPWSELGALGSSDIMRGYYSGRYRDKNYIAAQVEYRLVFNKLLGMVFFAGAGEVADRLSNFTIQGLKPNGGAGLRVKINRHERLNLKFDAGVGLNGVNFYLGAAEAF